MATRTSNVVAFIVNESELIGFSYEGDLKINLIGQLFILVFSVSMREVMKYYKVFSDKDNRRRTTNEQFDDLENRNSIRTPMLNSQNSQYATSPKSKFQIETYEKYVNISLLDQW